MTETKTVELKDATNNELRYYAGIVLGIEDIKAGQKNDFLMSKISAVDSSLSEIIVPVDIKAALNGEDQEENQRPAVEVAGQATSLVAKTHFTNDPRIEVNLGRSSEDGKPDRIPVCVNGDTIVIQRGKWVNIPYRHFLALEDAKEIIRVEDGVDPATQAVTYRDEETQSYAVSSRNGPSQNIIDAWHARLNQAPEAKAA